jgi:hypothetical protein
MIVEEKARTIFNNAPPRVRLCGYHCCAVAALLLLLNSAAAQEATPPPPELDLPQAAPMLAANTDVQTTVADPLSNNPLFEVPPVEKLPPLAMPPGPQTEPSPTTSVTLNLLRLMVAKKLISEEEAAGLIAQATQEAELAKANQLEDATLMAGTEDDVRVTYIPENVKQQMREDIKQEVLEQAREERWAAPNSAPEWTERMNWFGEIRLRGRMDLLEDRGNDNTGAFPDFNAINTGPPFDTAGTQFSPQHNVDQDRTIFQLLARLGLQASLGEGWYVGVGFGTGENNSPVTLNQGLGTANNRQGGNFSKYDLWLDRAFIRYEIGSGLGDNLNLLLGRYDNPFFSTEMMWDEDLGFDGLALKGRKTFGDGASFFGTAGIFPLFNTDLNFAANQPAKFKSTDRYLYGAQAGLNFKLSDRVTGRLGAAWHHFQDIEGRLSTPYVPLTPEDAGDTDNTRPSFAQRGNTYRPLRAIIPTVDNNFGTINQWQYYGLASKFSDINVTARVDIDVWEPYRFSFIADYVRNVAWDEAAINAVAVNNRGASPGAGQIGAYEGGNNAFKVRTEFGKPRLEKARDWRAWLDYRYVESDAMPDAFTDSDFGGGGTNFQGFSMGAQMALSQRVWLGARWMSTTEIAGPPLRMDILMFDITASF